MHLRKGLVSNTYIQDIFLYFPCSGGLHDNSSYENCTGGAAGYIDQMWLGNGHIYQWPTCRKIYQTGGFDPEGILGYLTSIFLVFLGLQVIFTFINEISLLK